MFIRCIKHISLPHNLIERVVVMEINAKDCQEKEIMTENDKLKYEIALELGLLDRVEKYGWKSLTAKETGRIGGLMTKRKRSSKQFSETKQNNQVSNG